MQRRLVRRLRRDADARHVEVLARGASPVLLSQQRAVDHFLLLLPASRRRRDKRFLQMERDRV